jgi:SAM-dependent methyltransferase
MHAEAREFVSSVVTGRRFARVVEVGGRDINGGVRDLIDCGAYTALDLAYGPGVNVVADCRDWSPEEPVDLVVCCEVLEHADDPESVVAACMSYLASGGQLVLTCAGPGREPHSAHDGGQLRGGEHYGNVDPDDLRSWLEGLEDVSVDHHASRGDVYAMGVR